jgi:rsbT co-antagonist protein RsbR
LDITGVPVVDTQVAKGLVETVQSLRLLGAEGVLVGVRPEVAQTIIGLGLTLASIQTAADVQSAVTSDLPVTSARLP